MAQASPTEPTVTSGGIEVSVIANGRSREDVELAMEGGADGIGLFRTEPFFLLAKHFPSDKEFAEFLLDSLSPARGKHIDVRLLDIGAVPFLDRNVIKLKGSLNPGIAMVSVSGAGCISRLPVVDHWSSWGTHSGADPCHCARSVLVCRRLGRACRNLARP